MSASSEVVVIGGGYAGINVASALDEYADVVLVEPKDAFQHSIAALRAVVDPDWPERIFLPYDRLLARGKVLRDRAVSVTADRVVLASGDQLTPNVVVLATGSTYPFPAKTDRLDHLEAIPRYHATRGELLRAERIMLLGAGAVGLELAGEISAAWPHKRVVLVDQANEVLPGAFDGRLREELNRQLDALGVQRVLGSPLVELPPTAPAEFGPFVVTTASGTPVEADIWFRCHGVAPVTDYLDGDLVGARTPDGYLRVDSHLRVAGSSSVYALGDIAAIDANMASVARRQAEVVVANVRAHLGGQGEPVAYTPIKPGIVLPLGPTGGAGQIPGTGDLLSPQQVAAFKGRDLLIDRYLQLFHLDAVAP